MSNPATELRKLLTVLLLVCFVLGGAVAAYPALHADRIYPGVSAGGVALGGLTVKEAGAVLMESFPAQSQSPITLRGPDDSWQLDPAETGHRYDWSATAESAYGLFRHGPWHARVVGAWRARLRGERVDMRIQPANQSQVEDILEDIVPQARVSPTNAQLQIEEGAVTCFQGEAGRTIDVEATSHRVLSALEHGKSTVDMVMVELHPDIQQPEPGCSRARQLVSQPFTLVADDPLTDYWSTFEASRARIASWLLPTTGDGHIALEVNETRLRTWLEGIAPQLGAERILATHETLNRVVEALDNGEHQARCTIRHPEATYLVEPGDTLFDIAYHHGFPQWRLEEANPDVEPDQLLIGTELTVPSIDVLFPEPLVPGKRIEIDLPTQGLQAYEDDDLIFEFTISSGMTKTPTIAGQFQVLFKEDNAYAQRWALEMPHFMAIYYERPGFANGIHELPIGADGHRLWSSVLGWPASYGCIILDVGDAEKLYEWAPVGTLVRIKGVAPGTPRYVPTYDEQASGQ